MFMVQIEFFRTFARLSSRRTGLQAAKNLFFSAAALLSSDFHAPTSFSGWRRRHFPCVD